MFLLLPLDSYSFFLILCILFDSLVLQGRFFLLGVRMRGAIRTLANIKKEELFNSSCNNGEILLPSSPFLMSVVVRASPLHEALEPSRISTMKFFNLTRNVQLDSKYTFEKFQWCYSHLVSHHWK